MSFEKMNQNIESAISHEKLPKPVYYIESPEDETVLVGMDVTVTIEADKNPVVSWFDTTKERRMEADEIRRKGDIFAFKRPDGDGDKHYFFTPIDLDIYNDKVRDKIPDGQSFNNVDDLVKAFQKTRENAD